ncbi:putative lipoprotein [Brucella pseudogrignonensis]|uniref:Putative lipoprotein n=1 Tax=Brucella pseudogrignonensis TaxID=419475 RepID=A0A256GF78_9HYPH|nr:putative lipoprotein [Brucella pseudogrignonensis]
MGANSCWFKSNDKDFRGYAFAPELNSFSGRPRMLVVPARNLAGRPLLVVQAEGNPARIEAFGPMMQQGHSSRISADINRWASGQKGC